MQLTDTTLAQLATALAAERKRQKLSREDAAAVCGVSTSFIRDAESNPANCSLGKLAKLIGGLGLSLEVSGFAAPTATRSGGLLAAEARLGKADFGVADAQLVRRHD